MRFFIISFFALSGCSTIMQSQINQVGKDTYYVSAVYTLGVGAYSKANQKLLDDARTHCAFNALQVDRLNNNGNVIDLTFRCLPHDSMEYLQAPPLKINNDFPL